MAADELSGTNGSVSSSVLNEHFEKGFGGDTTEVLSLVSTDAQLIIVHKQMLNCSVKNTAKDH